MKFRKILSFVLNSPYTLAGLLLSSIYIPFRITWDGETYAIIVSVRNDRFALFPYMKGWRAFNCGHTVVLGPREEENDLEHELIHVRQFIQYPGIFFFLYYIELLRKGYAHNRFEVEAYTKAKNVYTGMA
jgi:hypothetical protein